MPFTFIKDGKEVRTLQEAFLDEPAPEGKARQYSVQVRNDYGGDVRRVEWMIIKDGQVEPDARVLIGPTVLKKGEIGEMIIEFAPKDGRDRGLVGELAWEAAVL